MVSAERLIETYRVLVDTHLDAILPPESQQPVELHRAMRYSSLAPGKRLRPAMLISCSEAVGGDVSASLGAASAVELVHSFSLIHDDLPAIDNDDLRRGRPTCDKVFGEAMAILAGDALFALAFEALAESCVNLDGASTRRALLVLAKASGSDGLVGGEVADVLAEGQPVSPEAVEWIHLRKTAALFAASCELGALVGGETDTAPFAEYGLHVGLAFQIADDVLNETSTTEQLGKSVGSDRDRGKATYPAAYGVDRARDEAVNHLANGKAALERIGRLTPHLECLANFSLNRTA